MARLGLACALGVGILFWPYAARCGFGLAGYLGAVTTLVVAGVWSSIWTWKHRAARAHTVSLLLLTWGLVLAGAEVLPRVGYAKPSINHPAHWTCCLPENKLINGGFLGRRVKSSGLTVLGRGVLGQVRRGPAESFH